MLVRLAVVGNTQQFNSSDHTPQKDDTVVVSTTEGERLGVVLLPPEKNPRAPTLRPLRRVLTEEAVHQHQEKEAIALAACRRITHDIGPAPTASGRPRMVPQQESALLNFVAAELSPDRKRATFYFTSPERVDFRRLVREFAKHFHRRIDLRQIGVRDAARHTGGRGVCGRSQCCSSFLPTFQPVSMRMAKKQGLVLGSEKLSGNCGRLRCCLRFEQDLYNNGVLP